MQASLLRTALLLSATLASAASIAQTVTYTAPPNSQVGVDFVHATAMPLPRSSVVRDPVKAMVNALTSAAPAGTPGRSPGSGGDNSRSSTESVGELAAPEFGGFTRSEIGPQEFGTSAHPFSTAKADLSTSGTTAFATNIYYPYRASGKLFFKINGSTYMCTASLIKRGVVVTAAHCVTAFGGAWYSGWQFIPGYRNGSAPYGTWAVSNVTVMTSYKNGVDNCSAPGVVCENDIAVLTLTPQRGAYPGTRTGWYGYGWDGYGFNAGAPNFTHITQIGYPGCLDNGSYMERNDTHGYTDSGNVNNTVIGSLMCGGSSGGPWVVNFGVRPALTSTTPGSAPDANIVIGVTSWGYVDGTIKQQGASRFTSNNMGQLMSSVCPPSNTLAYCN